MNFAYGYAHNDPAATQSLGPIQQTRFDIPIRGKSRKPIRKMVKLEDIEDPLVLVSSQVLEAFPVLEIRSTFSSLPYRRQCLNLSIDPYYPLYLPDSCS